MTRPDSVDALIARREKLTNRRDGWIDFGKVDAIDAKLSAACPAGQRNDVDLLLGRSCATLPKRVVMVHHSDGMQSVDEQWADQTEDYLDWIASRGDLAL